MTNFEDILLALKGVTVVVQPRVSRETIIDILREHTTILREFKEVRLLFSSISLCHLFSNIWIIEYFHHLLVFLCL